MPRNLIVRLEGDASDLLQAFHQASRATQGFERDLSKVGRGALAGGGLFHGLGRSVAFASTAFLGGFGFLAAVRASFTELEDLQAVTKATESALESSGHVAGVTAEHVEILAKRLAELTGQSSASVQAVENLLLGFTDIRDVGADKIFDQAARASINLAAKLGTDLPSATKTLGKALQNPIRGVQALTRAGVVLEDSQAKLVKRLVKAGDQIGAQKVILQAVNAFTQGAAETDTFARHLARLRNNLLELGANIESNFLPALTKTVDQINAWVTSADNQKRVTAAVTDAVGAAGNVLKKFQAGFEALNVVTGSTKRSLELLLGAFLAFKAVKVVSTLVAVAADFGLIGVESRAAAGGVAAAGAASGAATAEVAALGAAASTSAAELAVLKAELAFPTTLNTSLGVTTGEVAGIGAAATTSSTEVAALKGQLATMPAAGATAAAGAVAGVGTGAATATGEVAALRTGLLSLGTLGPIAIAVTIALAITESAQYKAFRKFINDISPGGDTGRQITTLLTGNIGEVIKVAKQDVPETAHALGEQLKGDLVTGPFFKGADSLFHKLKGKVDELRRQTRDAFDVAADVPGRRGTDEFLPTTPPGAAEPIDPALRRKANAAARQRRQDLAQLKVDRAALTKGTADDVRALEALDQLLKKRIRGARKAGRDALQFEQEQIGVEKQLSDLIAQQHEAAQQAVVDRAQLAIDRAGLTKSVSDDIAALERLNAILLKRIKTGHATIDLQEQQIAVQQQINELLEQQKTARQFRVLGLGPTGEDLTPGVKNLKRQLRDVRKAIDDTFLDTRKNRSLLAGIKKVLADPGGVTDTVRAKIRDIIADLKNQLKTATVDVTKFQQTARGQFTLAGAHPGGQLTIHGGIHLHGVQDIRQLENQLAKRAKTRAHARRGNR